MYASPYFTGDKAFKLSEFPEESARASTMEAKVYSLRFPDWKPVEVLVYDWIPWRRDRRVLRALLAAPVEMRPGPGP